MENQKQKVAIVTGSSKGIGKAIAIKLAKEGYFVFVTYFTDKAGGLDTVAQIEKLGGKAYLHKVDVSCESDVVALMDSVEKQFVYLDVLVNNAVRSIDKKIEDSSYEEWKLAIDSKLHGAWLATKYALPLLKKSKNANVIVISSNADEKPPAEVLSYAIATAATNSFTKAMAGYLPQFGIRVNAIMPGEVRTDNWGDAQYDDALWKKFADNNPMKRVATVEYVADAVMFPINDPHKFLNGNFIYVNGGGHLK